MSSEWTFAPLENCLDALIDYRGKTPEKTGAGVPLITAKIIKGGRIETPTEFIAADNYDSWMRRGIPIEGDIVLTVEAPLGEVAQLGPEKIALAQRVVTLRGKEGVLDNSYLLYLLQTEEMLEQLKSRATGTTVLGIKQSELRKVPLSLPPINQQKAVAQTLKALDDRINLLRETNTTLEAIAQALFKSWFVDFYPVRAKAERLEPEGMDAATAELFPDSFEESELGLLPAGWEVRPIGKLVEGIYDGPHATPAESESGPIFLGIKNLTGTRLELANIRRISENDWSKWTRRIEPTHGDIVFSYEATLGFFAVIPPEIRCCLGRRLALIRPHTEDGAGLFWFHQFISIPFQQMLDKHTIHGATVNRIALKAFPSYSVLNPPEALKLAFNDLVEPLWATIHSNQAHLNTLTQLRDTLLPRLISGQLRLPETEAPHENMLSEAF